MAEFEYIRNFKAVYGLQDFCHPEARRERLVTWAGGKFYGAHLRPAVASP